MFGNGRLDEFDVLVEAEEELRGISPVDGVHGTNASDYKHLYDLFLQVKESAAAIRSNPTAFATAHGYNDKVINAYTRLVSTAMKALSDLNRMRNNDRLVASMLDSHTKELAQSVTIDLARDLRELIGEVDNGLTSDETVIRLKQLLYKRLPEVLLANAQKSLTSSKREFGLLQ